MPTILAGRNRGKIYPSYQNLPLSWGMNGRGIILWPCWGFGRAFFLLNESYLIPDTTGRTNRSELASLYPVARESLVRRQPGTGTDAEG
jgi:hypothetical protein